MLCLLRPSTRVIRETIREWKKKAGGVKASVRRLSRLFEVGLTDEVYEAPKRAAKAAAAAQSCPVRKALRAAFEDSGRVYGSRRLRATLRAQGLAVGRCRVRRLMRELHSTLGYRSPVDFENALSR